MARPLLIRDASLLDGKRADVRVEDGRITGIGRGVLEATSSLVIDARGGLLLPGLHDHHIHVSALAAARASLRCGPPDVTDAEGLAAALSVPGEGWLRGIGYHESVSGLLDRQWLDSVTGDRPVRIQHRGGRMWMLNSAGLDRLLASGLAPPAGLDRATGRLFDEDAWMRSALGGEQPAFGRVGAELARFGITGVTEISPANNDTVAAHFAAEHCRGALPQRVLMGGKPELGRMPLDPTIRLGPVKLHLHEAQMPNFDETVATIRAAHGAGRAVAVHCVTLVELVFTLAAIRDADAMAGDRIEHASIAPDEQVAEIAALGLAVVAQPHFVAERGDAYLADVDPADRPYLYRLRAFRKAGVTLAGGSDAPFGSPDPWAAMAAAVSRRTPSEQLVGAHEALTPEEALDLFLADPVDLGRCRVVETGAVADLCLLDAPWGEIRNGLSADRVRTTIIGGRIVHQRIDQAPAERHLRADALA